MQKQLNSVVAFRKPAQAGSLAVEDRKAAEARAEVASFLGLDRMAAIRQSNTRSRSAARKLVSECANAYATLSKEKRKLVSWKEACSAIEDMCTVVQRGMDNNEHMGWRKFVNGAVVRLMKADGLGKQESNGNVIAANFL